MTIDWSVVATIAAPIVALFAGVWVNHKFESRPVLISHFGHISAFRSTTPSGQSLQVHTHSVVLRNTGRRPATTVRVHHAVLPDFSIWPSIVHHVEDLPDGTRDIVIPTLIPGEEVTISYLYFPPLTAVGVNAGIKSDQGFAQAIPVLLQRQWPQWWNRLAALLVIVGIVSVFYMLFLAARWMWMVPNSC